MERIENNGCVTVKTDTGFKGMKIHKTIQESRHDLFCATCGIDYIGGER